MKKILFVFLVLFAFSTLNSPVVVEAGQQVSQSLQEKARKGKKLTKKERSILRSAGLIDKKGKWIGPRTAANPKPKKAQGSQVDQGMVLAGPTFKVCQDFSKRGNRISTTNRRGKKYCPPGYGCAVNRSQAGSVVRDCVWLNNVPAGARRPEHLPASHAACKWDACVV